MRGSKPNVQNSADMSLYSVLGVDKKADAKEIKKAYFALAKEHHPDKAGSENKEKFQEIQRAYDILSDPEKRSHYDMTGQTGEEGGPPPGFGGGGPFGFPFDIGAMFGMFGGGGGGGGGGPRRRQKRAKGPNKSHEIGLKLEDLYYGRNLRVEFERQVFCETCKGEGCKSWKPCDQCNGSGIKEQHIMVGPGMMAVQRGPCLGCQGEGRHKGPSCEGCEGRGLNSKHKSLDVRIEPGSRPGDVLTFPRECSDHPDFEEAGDVLIILTEAEEETIFKRAGDNLSCECIITLRESLLGCEKEFKGHPGFPGGLQIPIPAGTQNNVTLSFQGKGMPRKGVVGEKGDLNLTIKVIPTADEILHLTERRGLLEQLFS